MNASGILPALCTAILCCTAAPLGAQTLETIVRFSPLVVGYHCTFNSSGIDAHHLNVGVGWLYGHIPGDSLVREPGGLMASATVEIGLKNGHLVFAPQASAYLAGGLMLGCSVGLITDGQFTSALLRPVFGVGLLELGEGSFLFGYGYTIVYPGFSTLPSGSVGIIDIPLHSKR